MGATRAEKPGGCDVSGCTEKSLGHKQGGLPRELTGHLGLAIFNAQIHDIP